MFKNEGKNQGNIDPSEKKNSKTMHTKILLGLLVGSVAGLIVSLTFGPKNTGLVWTVENITQPLGDLWLRLLLMIVIPFVFSALVLGGLLIHVLTAATFVTRSEGYHLNNELWPPPIKNSRYGVD